MILKKLHDARERLANAEAIIATADALATLLRGNHAHITGEIQAVTRYREHKAITSEDLALVALELRRDMIDHSLGTLSERKASFERERTQAKQAVDELQAMIEKSLAESEPLLTDEPSAPAADSA